MINAKTKEDLMRVICTFCDTGSSESGSECDICHGYRYFLWDPDSYRCFTAELDEVTLEDESGTAIPVLRDPLVSLAYQRSVEVLLNEIEEWVRSSPLRKWKLTLDSDGWHACVWFNRYTKVCFDTSDPVLETCVRLSYLAIRRSANEE